MRLPRRTRHLASAVTLILLLVSSCVLAQSQRPPEEPSTNSAQQPATADTRGTAASPLIVQVQPTPKTDVENAEEQRQENQQASDRNWTRGLAIVTTLVGFLQLIAIVCQVYIASRQNQIIKRQNRIMGRQRAAMTQQSKYMRDGLTETKRAAEAATDNARSAEANATSAANALATNKAIERAYIYVGNVRRFEGFDEGGTPLVLFDVINSGHTPGWILKTGVATIPVSDVTRYLPRPIPVDQIGMRTNRQIVFAGQRTTFGNKLGPVQATDYTNVHDGIWTLVVFGRIEYRDTFGDTHHTDFSFVWDKFKEGVSGPADFHIHPDGYIDAD